MDDSVWSSITPRNIIPSFILRLMFILMINGLFRVPFSSMHSDFFSLKLNLCFGPQPYIFSSTSLAIISNSHLLLPSMITAVSSA